MSEFFSPNDWLPDGITPMPNLGPPCVECGRPTHIYEANLSVRPDGGVVCGDCTRITIKRAGRDPRQMIRNFFWRHGHDPMDNEAVEGSGVEYVTLEQTVAPKINQRDLLHGGPESPFPCLTCGALLRAAAERSVAEVLAPMGYKPPAGRIAPKETIVALVCPNDKPEARHKYMQIRRSMLEFAMRQKGVRNG